MAKFFINTLLEQNLESAEVKLQEFTFIKKPDPELCIRENIQAQLSIGVFPSTCRKFSEA